MAKALIISPHPDKTGGVADFVGMLKAHLPANIQVDALFAGWRRLPAGLQPFAPLLPLYDALRLLWRLLARHYDVVHLNPSFNKALLRDSLFMLVLRLIGTARVLVFMHGWNDAWARRILSGQLSRALFRWVWGGAGRILVLASRFKQALVDAGLDGGRIEVVSTMFDPAQFDGVASRRGSQPVQVLFLSRFVREKGGYELIEGFAQVAQTFPDVRLICAGDGPETDGMRAAAAKLGLDGRISFPGFVRGREKAQLLADADIFAFPTYYGEGCPVSLLEAMAAGCAVITGDAGGIPDIFEDGVNGVMLTKPTSASVAEALQGLLYDAANRRKIGDRNRDIAFQRFEAGTASRRIENLYCQIAAESAR